MVCNVTAALKEAGLGRQSRDVYDRRRRDPEYRGRWDEAIGESYAMLELEMLARSRHGENRPPPTTEAERRLRELSDRQALNLLRLHKSGVKGRQPACAAAVARRETARCVEKRLGEISRRLGGHWLSDGRACRDCPAFATRSRRVFCRRPSGSRCCAPRERLKFLRWLERTGRLEEFVARWTYWARAGQLPPDGAWRIWLMMAGRGFGKTRAGAEWVSHLARGGGAAHRRSSARPRTRPSG